jgi:hypothetical protein
MANKYQKDWSEVLKRNILYVETPSVRAFGGKQSYVINNILRTKGTKKSVIYDKFMAAVQATFQQTNSEAECLQISSASQYLKSLGNRKTTDCEIYKKLKKVYMDEFDTNSHNIATFQKFIATSRNLQLDSNLFSSASGASESDQDLHASGASESDQDLYASSLPIFRILTEKIPRKKYRRRNKEEKNQIHWGQRKLLLSEIEFLTLFLQSEKFIENPNKKIYMIYAGAAPGTHILYLASLFPNIYFILYDPREFNPILKKNKKIQTFVQLFLDETAAEWKSEDHPDKHILLVSDIRTAEPDTMMPKEVEDHIRSDNQMQKQWYEIMKPTMSMFKFRLPWDKKTTEYPRGDIYIQIFPPLTSTETRLIVHGPDAPVKIYDNKEYEERMFYFNTEHRLYLYENSLSEFSVQEKEGLNNQYDSVSEIYVLTEYLKHMGKNYTPKSIIKMSKLISNELSRNRTLLCAQPLKKYACGIITKMKRMGLIPKKEPFTRPTYHRYVIQNYDDLVRRGILDPNIDEGGISAETIKKKKASQKKKSPQKKRNMF